MIRFVPLFAFILIGKFAYANPSEPEVDLSSAVVRILEERCASCHGQVNPQSGLNVLNHEALQKVLLADEKSRAVIPGELEKSELWNRIAAQDKDLVMPPDNPISQEEQGIIQRWILAGAPEFPTDLQRRPLISSRDIYIEIDSFLADVSPEKAARLRFFSIAHLHNNPQVSDADLRIYRAALSKLINSLSWQSNIVVPQSIDNHQTILCIDLAEIGWVEGRLWNKLLTQYPYGLAYDSSPDPQFSQAAARVYDKTGTQVPIVRADWFVATAAIPPLYHDLLMLPSGPGADQVLERQLNVDVERDFTESLLQRAGFIHSNVSEHNRLVDRHRSRFGYYWKSYDFKSSFGRQNLSQFPLGPDFQDNQFVRKAFQHDGGEIIFSLPNGLQGYLLIDANGTRIDRGPIEVVYDSKQPLGNKEVINGISCMVCHNRGMQPFHDDIRQGNSLTGSDLRKVHALFPTNEKFNEIIDADAQRFLQALRAATSPFLTENDDIVKREPVGAIARQYTGELNLTEIAAELGISDQNRIQLLFNERAFAQFGLRIVAQDGVLKREVWHKVNAQQRYSIYQLVSEQLGVGVPVRFTQ